MLFTVSCDRAPLAHSARASRHARPSQSAGPAKDVTRVSVAPTRQVAPARWVRTAAGAPTRAEPVAPTSAAVNRRARTAPGRGLGQPDGRSPSGERSSASEPHPCGAGWVGESGCAAHDAAAPRHRGSEAQERRGSRRLLTITHDPGESDQPRAVPFRVADPDVGEIRVEGRAMPEREPDGSVLWRGFLNDISARRRVENAVRRSEERFALAMQGTGEGRWAWDLETDATYMSPR
jgi:PAS domain-containing protein